MFVFDAFPDKPDDPAADGVHKLGSSLERVLRLNVPDDMGVQRYDIPDPETPGSFRVKTWSPSSHAFASGEPVLLPELERAGHAWPGFVQAACGLGATSMFAYPLRTATATVGTLTLYRRNRRAGGAPVDAATFADIATVLVLADTDNGIIDLLAAAGDEEDINVAVGFLSATRRIPIEDARTLVREKARVGGRRPVDVARDLLTRRV